VELLHPRCQGGQDRRAPLLEYTLGKVARPVFRRLECIEKLFDWSTNEPGPLDEWPPFRRHAPDAAVGVIAARIAKINLAMLNDRVVPVGDVNGPIRPHFDV